MMPAWAQGAGKISGASWMEMTFAIGIASVKRSTRVSKCVCVKSTWSSASASRFASDMLLMRRLVQCGAQQRCQFVDRQAVERQRFFVLRQAFEAREQAREGVGRLAVLVGEPVERAQLPQRRDVHRIEEKRAPQCDFSLFECVACGEQRGQQDVRIG